MREAREANRERYIEYIYHGADNNVHSSGEDLLESNRPVVYIIVNEREKLRVSLSKINCEVKRWLSLCYTDYSMLMLNK